MATVLVLDGDEETRSLTWRLISSLGLTVEALPGLPRPLDRRRFSGVEVVICDPAVLGGNVAETLLKVQRALGRSLPLILMSRSMGEAEVLAGMDPGLRILGCLDKPADVDDLAQLLDHGLRAGLNPELVRRLAKVRKVGGGEERANDFLLKGADLAQVSPVALLYSAMTLEVSGVLRIVVDNSVVDIEMKRGEIAGLDLDGAPPDLLGFLRERGLISGVQAPADAEVRELSKQLNYAEGLGVMRADRLEALLQNIVVEALIPLLRQRSGSAEFLLGSRCSHRFPREFLAMQTCFQAVRALAFRDPGVLSVADEATVRSTFWPSAREREWGLLPEELSLVQKARAPGARGVRMSRFLGTCPDGAEREKARMMLYFLQAAGLVRITPADAWIHEVKSAEELYKIFAQVDEPDPFRALGLRSDATVEEVREAFRELSRKAHPDRFFSRHERIRRLVEAITQRVVAANELIGSAEAQEKWRHERDLAEGRVKEQDPARCRAELRLGNQALKVKNFEKARHHFEEAAAYDTEAAEPAAWLLWTRFLADPATRDEARKGMLALVRVDKPTDTAHLLLGRMYRILGDLERAELCFRRTISVNPKNVEATRELRLLQKRAEERTKESSWWNRPIFGGRKGD